MYVVGLDIGGANLKVADTTGKSVSQAFPLWQRPAELPTELRLLLQAFESPDLLAVTMTGELADCFVDKTDGVDSILTAVEQAAAGTPIVVWQTGAEFLEPAVAREIPLLVAAANWHAQATWLGRILPSPSRAVLIDIGSTTTDLIPLKDGFVAAQGMTDYERLRHGELVYTGIRRTPVGMVARQITVDNQSIPLAAEVFATMHDVYLLTGDCAPDATDQETADGRPATCENAHRRLARMLCCDVNECMPQQAKAIAAEFATRQIETIQQQLKRVMTGLSKPITQVIVSGSGAWLASRIADNHPELQSAERHSLPEMLGSNTATAACAHAVARLAAERVHL